MRTKWCRVRTLCAALVCVVGVTPAIGESLRAFVYEYADEWTEATGAAEAMRRAGFDVTEASLNDPHRFDDAAVIVFGSFVSEHPSYASFMAKHATALIEFVEAGGVVVQFTQADQTEAVPPFLPLPLSARRVDDDPTKLHILARDHPLLAGFGDGNDSITLPEHFGRTAAWEVFSEQTGFRVLLAAARDGQYPALLEGEVGAGRILLAALYLDKLTNADGEAVAPKAFASAADRFFTNLHAYVSLVQSGKADRVMPTPPYTPPAPLPFAQGSWSIVLLPDTQLYSLHHPDIFLVQTEWIAANVKQHNIKYVLHLGDIVHTNTEAEWKVARRAMAQLDGVVPYALAPGNHDYGERGSANNRATLLNTYFPVADYRDWPTFGGTFEADRIDSSYHLFTAGGRDWIVLALEWGPRDAVVAWADELLREHPDRDAILVTHAYLYDDDTRYDRANRPDQHWSPYAYGTADLPAGTNDGEDLWRKLVSRHPRMRFTFNGHVLGDGQGRLSTPGEHGNVVHQMLVNYQMREQGGEGYLRLVEFLPDGEMVRFRTYSPHLDRYLTDSQNQFTLPLPR
ncbi:MAG: metallophosphoesterase [Phycisphaerales bacterium]|nr:metallophosphoesterase [Phycisphaerales bacterium]